MGSLSRLATILGAKGIALQTMQATKVLSRTETYRLPLGVAGWDRLGQRF